MKVLLTDADFVQLAQRFDSLPDLWEKVRFIIKTPGLCSSCIIKPMTKQTGGDWYSIGFNIETTDKAHEIGNFYVIINKDLRNSALQKDIQIRLKLCKTQIEKVYLIEEELSALKRKRQYPAEEYQQGYSNIKRKLNPFKFRYPTALNWWKNSQFFSIGILNQVTEGAADCELEMYLIDLVEKIKTGHSDLIEDKAAPLSEEFIQALGEIPISCRKREPGKKRPRGTVNQGKFDNKCLNDIWANSKKEVYNKLIELLSSEKIIQVTDQQKPIWLSKKTYSGYLYNLLASEYLNKAPIPKEQIKILNNTFTFPRGEIALTSVDMFHPDNNLPQEFENTIKKIIYRLQKPI